MARTGLTSRARGVHKLDPAQGACERHAMLVLKEHGLDAAKVVRVEPDLILWVGRDGRAWTSPITADPKGRVLLGESRPGFQVL